MFWPLSSCLSKVDSIHFLGKGPLFIEPVSENYGWILVLVLFPFQLLGNPCKFRYTFRIHQVDMLCGTVNLFSGIYIQLEVL